MRRSATPVQLDVLRMMNNGWELGIYGGIDARCALQKDGLGRGGTMYPIGSSTVFAMERRGWIKSQAGKFPIEAVYVLTDDGRAELRR